MARDCHEARNVCRNRRSWTDWPRVPAGAAARSSAESKARRIAGSLSTHSSPRLSGVLRTRYASNANLKEPCECCSSKNTLRRTMEAASGSAQRHRTPYGEKRRGARRPLERTRLVCSGPFVAHLSWTVLALVLSFVLILTRLRCRTVIRLLRALSSLLCGPIGLLTDVLRLSTHDSPQRI